MEMALIQRTIQSEANLVETKEMMINIKIEKKSMYLSKKHTNFLKRFLKVYPTLQRLFSWNHHLTDVILFQCH